MIDFKLQNIPSIRTTNSRGHEMKKTNSVAANLGHTTEKKSSKLELNSSKCEENSIELFIYTKEKSNTYSPPKTFSSSHIKEKEKILTPTICPKKYINCRNMNYSSGGSSPLAIKLEEDMLIPNFVFIEENKYIDELSCKICKKNFQYFQEMKINCRKCGNSICKKCCTKTINENPICDICIYKLKHNNADKKREEKIQSLIEERKHLKETLEIKKEKIVDLTQNLVEYIKKTEETVGKQTEGCFNLKEKLKFCQQKKENLAEKLKICNDLISIKTIDLEKTKEMLDSMKKKINKETASNSNEPFPSSLKLSEKKSGDLELSFEGEFSNGKSLNDSLKYSSRRSSKNDA